MRNARDTVVVVVMFAVWGWAAVAHAQRPATESQARQYIYSAFLTHASHAIMHEQVALGPELGPRLALPAGASAGKIYEALVAMTDGKALRVRKATADELSGYGERTGFDPAHPAFTVEAGDLRLLVQYDLGANKVPFVGQLGLPDPEPKVVAKPEPEPAPKPEHKETPAATRLVWTGLFGYDSALLSESSRGELDTNVVLKLGDPGAVDEITINGYADELGSAEYNHRLSEKRAEMVRMYLISKGIAPEKTQIRAHGPSAPVAQCGGHKTHKERVECLAPNRRVVVEVQVR